MQLTRKDDSTFESVVDEFVAALEKAVEPLQATIAILGRIRAIEPNPEARGLATKELRTVAKQIGTLVDPKSPLTRMPELMGQLEQNLLTTGRRRR
jgi:hypothetical protein